MLLEFKTSNFKSFIDEVTFSMIPAQKQKDLEYSVLSYTIGKKSYKALSSAVIYGPNASGKTNIIGAMDTFKEIILRGNIQNVDDLRTPNTSATKLELIPNNTLNVPTPTMFYIKFIKEKMLFEYKLILDLGTFLNIDYERKIIEETLTINEKKVYTRNDDIHFFDLNVINKYLANDFIENKKSAHIFAMNNLNPDELFLTNGFKNIFSSKLVNVFTQWLEEQFLVIYRADAVEVSKKLSDSKKGIVYIEKTTNEAAKLFGINSNDLGYVVPKDGNEAKLCSIFKDLNAAIPAEMFESYGTVRFIKMFPLILKALVDGAILVLDEFDANIHPIALMNIVNLFHNDEINLNNSQLIFNTHNPIFLNANLFRRDEIKFVERNDDTHLSMHYSLADFKTSGTSGVRTTDDYMNRYFLGRYGAIKDIDFYNLFEEIVSKKKTEESLNEQKGN